MATHSFRLRPIMRQGTASSIPETWNHYASVEEARAGAKDMYRNDRVLRVMLVVDSLGSFVECSPHGSLACLLTVRFTTREQLDQFIEGCVACKNSLPR